MSEYAIENWGTFNEILLYLLSAGGGHKVFTGGQYFWDAMNVLRPTKIIINGGEGLGNIVLENDITSIIKNSDGYITEVCCGFMTFLNATLMRITYNIAYLQETEMFPQRTEFVVKIEPQEIAEL